MTRLFRTWLVAALASILALPLVSSRAIAADPAANVIETAKQHFLRGVSFYKDGDLDAALAEFSKAYETRPDYRVLYNIGQVQAERRDYAAAARAMRQYLKEGDRELDSERRVAVEQTLADMAKRVASLTVTANVANAEVLIDGISVAVLPLEEPLILNAGVRVITVRKDALTAPVRRVTVTGGEALRIGFQLEPAVSGAVPGEKVAPSAIGHHRTRAWIAYGAAVVLGATTATFAVLAHNADSALDTDLGRFPGDRAQIDDDRRRLRTWAGLTDGFAAATLIAAGVGTYFLFSSPAGGESPTPGQSAQVALLPSGAALSFSGSF
jgi:hypothetical protein